MFFFWHTFDMYDSTTPCPPLRSGTPPDQGQLVGPQSLKGQGMESRRPKAAFFLSLPSHPFGELSRGRAFAFYDRDICPRNVSSVSHMCALQEMRLMTYRFHRNCLKISADRLPLRGWAFHSAHFRLVRSYDPSVCSADSSPSPGSLEHFGLYGIFHIACVHSPYILVPHQRYSFPTTPIIPRFPISPIQKSIDHIVSFQL